MKICRICQEDCSDRPRIKDPKGQYYCKSCYASARAHAGAEAHGGEVAATGDDADVIPVLDELIPAAAGPAVCPGCGNALAAGAMLCTNCGYQTSSGEVLHVADAPPIAPGVVGASTGSTWPIIVGALAIVLGGLGVLGSISNVVMTFTGGAGGETSRSAGVAIGGLIGLLVHGYHCLGGLRVLRRTQRGAQMLKSWGRAISLLTMLLGTCLVGAVVIAMNQGSEELEQLGGPLLTILVVVLVISIAWPLFLWIWFTRDGVKRTVATWR